MQTEGLCLRTTHERLTIVTRSRQDVPTVLSQWDSNTITPGTPFMQRLSEHLAQFIRSKMLEEDPVWANLEAPDSPLTAVPQPHSSVTHCLGAGRFLGRP